MAREIKGAVISASDPFTGPIASGSALARSISLGTAAINAALVLGAVVVLAPIGWMVLTALRPAGEIYSSDLRLLPGELTLQNFREGWTSSHFAGYFLNSVIVAWSTTILSILINAGAGFAFAKYRFKGRETLFLLTLSGLMIPEQVRLVAVALIMTNLGWINTFQGVIFPSISQTTGVFLMRQYILTIPDEILEAARIDGSSDFRIFWRIILPLSAPAVAANAIIQFMWNWNALLWPLIVLRRQEMFTVQVGLAFMRANPAMTQGPLMAMAIVSAIPVLVVFFLLQSYFVRGLVLSGMK